MLLKLFLIMCANIKALLCDIEESFNMGYLCQYSGNDIELLITTGQKTRKILINTILTHVCPCTCVICRSHTQTLNKVRLTNTK